uniref:Uncharacterized protein n=1 Tax=Chromera velia CCMP2878 TaxID=1169474 RepID=A0A0G4H2T2_9ALVE|eukprot:Cvel_5601.t1-p1 / transcript=Cvel_5601.t1 / gene=Cvel_5601 / organism=Chromera_velia_CCMP2878 / gene_product=hypothetical protein / transcript_product=hypothetical protein / location=Cvel_scaffold263:101523-106434(-) / protein_length=238 / sequence_SO=supercontig / SO=protein_coding / is_pseudo=false
MLALLAIIAPVDIGVGRKVVLGRGWGKDRAGKKEKVAIKGIGGRRRRRSFGQYSRRIHIKPAGHPGRLPTQWDRDPIRALFTRKPEGKKTRAGASLDGAQVQTTSAHLHENTQTTRRPSTWGALEVAPSKASGSGGSSEKATAGRVREPGGPLAGSRRWRKRRAGEGNQESDRIRKEKKRGAADGGRKGQASREGEGEVKVCSPGTFSPWPDIQYQNAFSSVLTLNYSDGVALVHMAG